MARFSLCFLLLFMVVMVAEGVPKKPKKVKCHDRRYPNCFHKNLYCPASCLRTCVVNCATCQPVCTPPPPPPPPPPRVRSPRHSPPPPPKAYPSPPPITSTPPLPITYSPPPPPPIISTPPITYSPPPPPPIISTPPITYSPPPPPPIVISTPPSLYQPPPPPATSGPSSDSSAAKRVKCNNQNYPHCYGMELSCPSACPSQCEVDCVTCSPVCSKFLLPGCRSPSHNYEAK